VFLSAAMMALLLILGVSEHAASASSNSSIEGVWSFKGGQVDIEPGSGGTLKGIVVAPTKFAQCTHEDGEEMWQEMTLQKNGSYWGHHQWFYEAAECARNPTPGLTAWRVMEAPGGGHYLLVCFSSPEKPEQPIIEPNGGSKDVSYGCVGSEVESGHLAGLPGVAKSTSSASGGTESFREAVSLPGSRACFSRRIFQIHLKNPRYDPIKEVVVTLGKRKITVKRHGNVLRATIDLKGLPAGTFTVKIRVTTVLGHHLVGSRTYHTCARKPKSHKPKALKPVGH
jgi:hypothetical protein